MFPTSSCINRKPVRASNRSREIHSSNARVYNETQSASQRLEKSPAIPNYVPDSAYLAMITAS